MLQGITVIQNKLTVGYAAGGDVMQMATLDGGRLVPGITMPLTDTVGLDDVDGSIREVDDLGPKVQRVDAASGQVQQTWKLPGATAFGLLRAAGHWYISGEDGNNNYTLLDSNGSSPSGPGIGRHPS